jgi:hypothetical protein
VAAPPARRTGGMPAPEPMAESYVGSRRSVNGARPSHDPDPGEGTRPAAAASGQCGQGVGGVDEAVLGGTGTCGRVARGRQAGDGGKGGDGPQQLT